MRSTRELLPDALTGRIPDADRPSNLLAGIPGDRGVITLVGTAGRRTGRAMRAAAFWTAVALPVAYGPLLLRGVETPDRAGVVLGLVLLNLLALVVAHRHRHP